MYNDKNKKPKWYAETTIVDVETGEIIPRYLLDRGEYIKINTEKNVEFNNERNYGKRKFTIIAKRNPQTKLF